MNHADVPDVFYLFVDGTLELAPMSPRVLLDCLTGKVIFQGTLIGGVPPRVTTGATVRVKVQSGKLGTHITFDGRVTNLGAIASASADASMPPINYELAFDSITVKHDDLFAQLMGTRATEGP